MLAYGFKKGLLFRASLFSKVRGSSPKWVMFENSNAFKNEPFFKNNPFDSSIKK